MLPLMERQQGHVVVGQIDGDIVRGHEGSERRVGHEAGPPRLPVVRHGVAREARRAGPFVGGEGLRQLEGLRGVHDAARVVAVAAALVAAIARSIAAVLRDDAIQEKAGVEGDVLVDPPRPPIHIHALRVRRVQHIIHSQSPEGPPRIRAEGPPTCAGRRALALVLADERRVLPRHSLARQRIIRLAWSHDAHPIRDRAGLAGRVVQDVVARQNGAVERRSEVAELRLLPVEGLGEVCLESLVPHLREKLLEGAVVRRREVSRVVAPLRAQRFELAVRRRQTAPLGAGLGHEDALAIGERAVHVREAEVGRGEGDDEPNDDVDEVNGVVECPGDIHRAEHRVHIAVSGGAMARLPGVVGRAQVARELPGGDAGGAPAVDRGHAVRVGIHLQRGTVLLARATEGQLRVMVDALDHPKPGAQEAHGKILGPRIALRGEHSLNHQRIAHAFRDDATGETTCGMHHLGLHTLEQRRQRRVLEQRHLCLVLRRVSIQIAPRRKPDSERLPHGVATESRRCRSGVLLTSAWRRPLQHQQKRNRASNDGSHRVRRKGRWARLCRSRIRWASRDC
mmetsp:Transcript_28822/g.83431  ORF Transcript_28822/g.83431 Transcript_28822/m.83431 type:complete len:567 (-) Transcript_28822:9-1709(-)